MDTKVDYAFEREITAEDRKLHQDLSVQAVIDYRANEALAYQRLEKQYMAHRRMYPNIFSEYRELALTDVENGAKRLSINWQTEELRRRGYSIHNSMRSFYARDLSKIRTFFGLYRTKEQTSKRMVAPRAHKSSTTPVVKRAARRFGYEAGVTFSSAIRLHMMVAAYKKNASEDVDAMVQKIADSVNGWVQAVDTKTYHGRRVFVIIPKLQRNTFEEVYIELSVFGA